MPARPVDFIFPGLIAAQALYTAVQLGIPDKLRTAPRTAADLAPECSVDAVSLDRILRALSSIGIFEREPNGRYRNTTDSEIFRADHPLSLCNMALFLPSPHMWRALGAIPEAIRTGKPAFDLACGTSFFDYIAGRSEDSAVFDSLMAQEIRWITPPLIRAYDFTRFSCLVDVGGGEGVFLQAILSAAPRLRGVLFDQPHVVSKAERHLAGPLEARVRVVGGSFFESIPEGGDLYTLKRILHDWNDADAARILSNIRSSIRPDGTPVVLDALIDSPTHPAAMDDLMMLVLGGCERTESGFRSLFSSAGFALERTIPVGRYALLEARPV